MQGTEAPRQCRYTSRQLLAVALLTAGAIAATVAEALVGDTAAAARRSASAAACPGCAPGVAAPSRDGAALGDDSGPAFMLVWGAGILILITVLLLQVCPTSSVVLASSTLFVASPLLDVLK